MLRDRYYIRALFQRVLGLIFLDAFLSLGVQIGILVGHDGLLPACGYLASFQGRWRFIVAPTFFWFDCSDAALHAVVLAGALLSVALIVNLAPRYCLLALWALYLSCVTVSQDFLSFQWDNLLLETAFFTFFVTPGGMRPRRPPPPHPIGVFLMLWLVFRLHVESGAAKLLSGDPTWRDLTAMVSYYETAPLPTWVGWYVHQLPVWAHQLCALFTFVVELLAPLAIIGPRRFRLPAFLLMIAMQVSVISTANYGFFNYLTAALCVWVLDDGHLAWVARRVGMTLPMPPAAAPPATGVTSAAWPRHLRRAPSAIVAGVLVLLSVLPFFPFLGPLRYELLTTRRWMNSLRSINAYHLFASMTLVRREIVIEGSNDGTTWLPYEFRYKPGDPLRAPPFVAPHQPRVDFQLWFLLLGGRGGEPYFDALLQHLLTTPATVAPLFAVDPFPTAPPHFLRVAIYRYTFTDAATRRATGAWWNREFIGYSRTMTRESFARE